MGLLKTISQFSESILLPVPPSEDHWLPPQLPLQIHSRINPSKQGTPSSKQPSALFSTDAATLRFFPPSPSLDPQILATTPRSGWNYAVLRFQTVRITVKSSSYWCKLRSNSLILERIKSSQNTCVFSDSGKWTIFRFSGS